MASRTAQQAVNPEAVVGRTAIPGALEAIPKSLTGRTPGEPWIVGRRAAMQAATCR